MKFPSRENRICKFYVVEYNTAIIGVSDSEALGLVNLNFDVIEKENSK